MTGLEAALQAALDERYVVEGEIARGGMAAVFLAAPRGREERVAIKVLLPEFARVVGPERFHREIAMLLGLRHPSILPLLASGQEGRLPYYIMPYAAGGSLQSRLGAPLPLAEVVAVARDIAGGARLRPRAQHRASRHKARKRGLRQGAGAGVRLRSGAGDRRGRW